MNRPARSFRDLLAERLVLFDGGTGTALYARGVFLNRCYEELNLVRPELVEEIHRSFLQAGADAIETNTFSGNRPRLEQHGLGEKVTEINRAAAQIARRSAGWKALVAGSVGPLGIRLEPWGPTSVSEAQELFGEQIRGLLDGDVDLIVVETFTDLMEIQAAVQAARDLCDLPVIAMMTVDGEGRTPEGVPAEWVVQKLETMGADVVGINCSVGPAPMLSVIETMGGMASRPLAAMPNAGIPRGVEGRMLYLTSPAYMGSYAKRFAAAGARVVGGCCGVTAEHIRAMREAIGEGDAGQAVPRVTVELPPRLSPKQAIRKAEKSFVARKVSQGRFITAVEVVPPRGWDLSGLDERIRDASRRGFDAAVVLSDPRHVGRMSSLAVARLIREWEGGNGELEPILQYTARDRPLPDVVSDLLGAHALGLRNIMLLTGRAPRPGEAAWTTPVFDVDAIGLTNVVTRLNHGLDVGDNPIGEPTAFFASVLATVGAPHIEEELRRLEWKVDAGAELMITSPIFDVSALELFLQRIEHVRVPVIASVVPLQSLRDAERFAGEVPGVQVTEAILARMAKAGENDAAGVGLEIASETVERVRPLVEGIMLAGPRSLDPDVWNRLDDIFGSDVPERRAFPGHPGVMGGSEGSRYEEDGEQDKPSSQ